MYSKKICRLCLWDDSKMINLHREQNGEHGLVHKIEYCLETTVSEDDNQSAFICRKCVGKIEKFYAFKINCNRSNTIQCNNRIGGRAQADIKRPVNNHFVDGPEKYPSLSDKDATGVCQIANEAPSLLHCNAFSASVNENDTACTDADSKNKHCTTAVVAPELFNINGAMVRREEVDELGNFQIGGESSTSISPTNTNIDGVQTVPVKSSDINQILRSSSKISKCSSKQLCLNNYIHKQNNGITQSSKLSSYVRVSDLWEWLNKHSNLELRLDSSRKPDVSKSENDSHVHEDKNFFLNEGLYNAYTHDLPLDTVFSSRSLVSHFPSGFIKCSYCGKFSSCMRRHLLHKSVCRKFIYCRYCSKKFISRIERQLHYLNECTPKAVGHDHGYAHFEKNAVTEENLMKQTKVHLVKLQICVKCCKIFKSENELVRHNKFCKSIECHNKSLTRICDSFKFPKYFDNSKLDTVKTGSDNSLTKNSNAIHVKSHNSRNVASNSDITLRNYSLSVKTRSAALANCKRTSKTKDICETTSILYAVGLMRKELSVPS